MRVFVAVIALLTTTAADWELLGTRRVNFRTDHDVIVVGARAGTYSAIKIDVAGGDLEMYNIRLTFGDGQTWSPNTRVLFRQGSWSRTIDVPGPARFIRRVDFWYRSRLRRGMATVRVFGRQGAATIEPSVTAPNEPAPAPAPAPPPAQTPLLQNAPPPQPPPTASEDEHLACRPVNFQSTRDSVIDPGSTPYRGVRFDVEGGDIELFDVKVSYADGSTYAPGTRISFTGGARTRTLDLPGDARAVARIDYSYRASGGLLSTGQITTTVHVYGRR